MRSPRLLSAVVCLALATPLAAEDSGPLLFRQPTLSREAIVFVFAGDLWSVARGGGEAKRLTASVGLERDPVFSPDGKTLLFSGEYDGNVDVFTMPATGGAPVRLTWHPGADRAVGWTRDGSRVLFRSARANGTRSQQLFSMPAAGGWPERLPLPEAFTGSYSPDGKRFAYMPHERFQLAWKRYRGGEATFVWLLDTASLDVTAVPRGNSNDSYPAWAEDGRVYFLSDREGGVTLFRYDPAGGGVERVFANDGLDLKNAQAGPGAVVFERFGEIGLYDLASGAVSFPEIAVASDLEARRPRWVKAGETVQGAALSPSGARAAFSTRGEIVTVPAEKGSARNVTRTVGAADRDPAWSPEGGRLAWISDAGGDTALHVGRGDGMEAAKRYPPPEPAFLYQPVWSPDGKSMALHDQALRLWVVDLASGGWTRVDTDLFDHPLRTLDPAWSPDSRYLAYTKREKTQIHSVWIYETATKRVRRATDGFADVRFPVFDASGKYLWFVASTDYGPTAPWLDMTSVEHPVSSAPWLMVLAAAEPSPFPPQSDEEKAKEESEKAVAAKDSAKDEKPADGKGAKEGEKPAAPAKTVIDFEGLARRVVLVPGVEPANFQALAAGKAGQVFLLAAPEVLDPDAEGPPSGALQRYDLEEREATKLADEVAALRVAADGTKLLVQSGESWSIVGSDAAIEAGKGKLALDAIEVRVDSPAEWRQIYREAWRRQRDFLYDPKAHGLDLAAAEKKYEPWVAGLAHRDDLNYLMIEMLGELSIGHLYVAGGDLPKPPKVKGGLLGADWEVANGRYRIVRILTGEAWNPGLEAPLDRPGVAAMAGDYLIAVDGRPVRAGEPLYAAFEGTAGKNVRIRLARDTEGAGARDVDVVPIADESDLRYRAWVEDNRRAVEKLSGGRIGYFHLPDTAGAGFTSFNRYFFPQIDKPALLVDERNNGGGLVADYIVEVLGRKPLWAVAARSGEDMISPAGAHYGPKAMLINRHAGSGGDALPWMFEKLGLGPLVGTRTWGGLVGIWDYPDTVDGGFVTAPRGGLYSIEGRWEVENRGVAPDYAIEITPRDFAAERDPQLEKGVELLLAALEEQPPVQPVRPPYPNYQVTPWSSEAEP